MEPNQRGRVERASGSFPAAGFVFVQIFAGCDLLEVFRFEYLVAIHTADVVDPIPTHHEFRSRMLAVWHRFQINPF